MHKQRLEQMVTMLRGLPEEKRQNFDLSDWHCGTSACAVGWACRDPAFISQGLRFDYEGIAPEFMGSEGWNAVKNFFDIGFDQARGLFNYDAYSNGKYATPAQVADRIAEFIAAQ